MALVYNSIKNQKKRGILDMYDIVIIGGGAAGLSAAIYACRGGMKTLVLEELSCGGQINYTYDVDNYPGFYENPKGEELSNNFRKHAEKLGAQIVTEKVREIDGCDKEIKIVKTRRNEYSTNTVIFATGAEPRKLGVPGEDTFSGLGVSYCATCDGAFFRGQTTLVVGGGNTAFEDALYLSRFSPKVYLVHRSQKFRADRKLVEQAMNNGRIEIVTDSVVECIHGKDAVDSVTIKNVQTKRESTIETSAVFVAIGRVPKSELAGKYVFLTQDGFVRTDREMQTDVKGIFAAGDVRDTPLRQIVTAAADGAVAAVSAIRYINQLG